MVLVPAFTFILKLGEKESRATSVFCILPMVCASSIFYFNSSYIDLKIRYSLYDTVELLVDFWVLSYFKSFQINI